MASSGLSWKELVDAGGLQDLFPSFTYSLSNYATSVLRNGATKNLTARLYDELFPSAAASASLSTPRSSVPR